MFMASLILILSAAMLMFYLQATCQKILRREFEHGYFQSVVNLNRLAFLAIQRELEHQDAPQDYEGLRASLRCDLTALTYLLKHANNASGGFAAEERLLVAYFRVMLFSLTLRHTFGLRQKPAIMKLTSILQYFSNVLGQRMCELRLGNLAASDYLAQ